MKLCKDCKHYKYSFGQGNCLHPNNIRINPENGRTILINDIKDLRRKESTISESKTCQLEAKWFEARTEEIESEEQNPIPQPSQFRVIKQKAPPSTIKSERLIHRAFIVAYLLLVALVIGGVVWSLASDLPLADAECVAK